MSWREVLGVATSTETPFTHNSQNTQKPMATGNCADIAGSAYRDSKEETSKLLEVLADACRGLDITPAEIKQAMIPKDIDDWRNGAIGVDTLTAVARAMVQRRVMDHGKRPDHYTEQANCKHCGPIWLWTSGDNQGCPWCWNRVANRPMPRPRAVLCGDCAYFERIKHPHLGNCAQDEPAAPAGFWDDDRRLCQRWSPMQFNRGVITHGKKAQP